MFQISDVEILLTELNTQYDFSECGEYPEDILLFIKNTICFPEEKLISINANNSYFFENLTLEESLKIILTRLMRQGDIISSKNGFPEQFNFQKDCEFQLLENGKIWIASSNNNISQNLNLLTSICKELNVNMENTCLLFHGTSWNSAIKIMEDVKTTNRGYPTDFGFENFYVTDDFHNSLKFANHNSQQAIVIFKLEKNFSEEMNVMDLWFYEGWKEILFNCRNGLICDLDSYDLVHGPIFSNPRVKDSDHVECMKNGDVFPYQYSFKKSSVKMLNNKILATIFINDKETNL